MAGRKFGIVIAEQVPGSYHALPNEEQDEAGEVIGQLMEKYAGKVDMLRRYWTSAFHAEVTDVFIMECDDLMDAHNFKQEMKELLARGGDPDRFGVTMAVFTGVNPDAAQ